MSNFEKFYKLLISLAFCQLAGFLGSIATSTTVSDWFMALQKPALMPPGWVFGVVWTVLFILMGIALWLVWINGAPVKRKKTALILFGAQWVLNILWSVIFFSLRELFWSNIELAVLFGLVAATIVYFFKQSKPAGYLLLPYLLWLCAAAYLNISIYLLN